MPSSIIASIHVAAGAIGLVLGPVAMWAPKRRGLHFQVGRLYFAILTTVCASAAALAIMNWQTRWWFFLIAIGTFASGALAYWAARRRPRHWLPLHVAGQLSSYTGMVTAFVVNNWYRVTGEHGVRSPLAFFIPMALGTLAVVWMLREVRLGRRPIGAPPSQQAT